MGLRLALAASTVLGSGCFLGADRSREDGVTVRDSAGVTLVHNAQRTVPSGCIVIAARPKTTIAPLPIDDAAAPVLHRVWGGALLSNGTIVLLNAGTQELLFFSQSGEYRRSVGGQGRGPGEFVGPDWLGHGSGDTLFVWDTRLGRLSIFSGEGKFLTSRRVLDQLPTVRGRFEDGSLLLDPISVVHISADGRVERDPKEYRRYAPRIVATNDLADGLSDEWVDGAGGPYSLPFGKGDLFSAHGMAFVVGDNGTSVLRYYDLQGQLRRYVSWVSDPIPVTNEDKRNYSEHHARDSRVGASQRGTTLFADVRPRFSAIESDRTGWLWVREFAAEWERPEDWLVFDEDGVLRCRVEMPSTFSVLEIGEDYILGRQENESDEESVVLFDLSRNY